MKLSSKTKSKVKTKKKLDDFSDLIPDTVKECKEFNPDMFKVEADFSAIKCDSNSVGKIQCAAHDVIMNRVNFKRVISDKKYGPNVRVVLLSRSIKLFDQLDDNLKEQIKILNGEFIKYSLHLTYSTFTLEEILKRMLPDDTSEIVSSFETIGHIAHVNLKHHMLPYKHTIGKLLLDKNPNIKTVVNKTSNIEETFRYFKMELLAGEDNMVATVQEHGSLFKFDYSKVYWNSRLQTEHQRIVSKLNHGDVVFDVFAGVGPFTIPSAKKQCTVFANDLNKDSVDALMDNAKLNKVSNCIKTFNMDGKEFLETVVIPELVDANHKTSKHIVMNLPAIAPEFLTVISEKYRDFAIPLTLCSHITVHCYCFSKSKTPQIDAEQIISHAIGYDVSTNSETYFVRRVAPNKVMMCVSFKLAWFENNSKKCTCSSSLKRQLEGSINEEYSGKKSIKIGEDLLVNKY